MPVAAAVGCDPVLFLAGSTLVSAQVDEYDIAGLARRRCRCSSPTRDGAPVAANAEIIAEGFIDPNELMDEARSASTPATTGNKGQGYPKLVLRVKRILHRNKPGCSGRPPSAADQRHPHDPVAQPHRCDVYSSRP